MSVVYGNLLKEDVKMEKVIIKENYNDKIVKPNKGLEKALKELDYMIKHSDEYKSYSTIEELFKALDDEE